MLGALVGVKAMVGYVAIAFICSVFFGWGLQKLDAQKWMKNVRLKKLSCGGGSYTNSILLKENRSIVKEFLKIETMMLFIGGLGMSEILVIALVVLLFGAAKKYPSS